MDMKKLLHTFDEADEILNDKIDRTNLSTIMASATASVENKKTVLIRGTGRNIEVLNVGGKTVQNGTPTPTNPVEVQGVGDLANLWNEKWEIGVYNNTNGVKQNDTTHIRCVDFIKVKPGETYYFATANSLIHLCMYDASKGYISSDTNVKDMAKKLPTNCHYITFNMSAAYGITYKNDTAILEGTSGKYVPYGKYKIPILTDGKSQNIYLDAPLFDGEIADLVGGKVEKKYGIVVLNENENWETGVTNNLRYFNIRVSTSRFSDAKKNVPVQSNVQIMQSTSNVAENMYINSSGYLVFFTQKLGNDLEAFKTWISTHNIFMVYELDTPTTETFEGSEIPVGSGEVELTLNTEVTPSSIESTTFGDYYSKVEVDKLINNLDTRLKALEPSATSLD